MFSITVLTRNDLYLVYVLLSTIRLHIPFWVAMSLLRSLRQLWTWPPQRSVLVRAFAHVVHLGDRYRPRMLPVVKALTIPHRPGGQDKTPNHLAIAEDAHVDGDWVKPVPELVHGQIK